MRYWLDIEASGLYAGSYPIEIGWIDEDGVSENYLIKPLPTWTTWSYESQMIHHIPRHKLESEGVDANVVATRALCVLGAPGNTVMTNAPSYDGNWFDTLIYDLNLSHKIMFRHTNEALTDAMGPLRKLVRTVKEPDETFALISGLSERLHREARAAADAQNFVAHRALSDAEKLRFIWKTLRDSVLYELEIRGIK